MAWINGLVLTRTTLAVFWLGFVLFLTLSSLDYTWAKFIKLRICSPIADWLFSAFGTQQSLSVTVPFLLVALPVLVTFLIASIATSTTATKAPGNQTFWLFPYYIETGNTNIVAALGFVVPFLLYILGRVVNAVMDWDEYGFWRSMENLSCVSGYVALIAMGVFLVPVVRINAVCEAVGWSPIDAVRIHVWLGALSIITTLHHGTVYLLKWWLRQDDLGGFEGHLFPPLQCFLPLQRSGVASTSDSALCAGVLRNLTGLIAGLAMLVLGLASMNCVRRASYRIFYMTHVAITPIALLATALHWNEAFLYLVPGVILWLSTTLPQRLQGSENVEIERVQVIQSERPLYSITFKAAPRVVQQFNGGHYMQLRAPSLSQLSHPFSVVVMASHATERTEGRLRVIFRAIGPFTKALGKYVTTHPSPAVQVEFPYGVPLLPKLLAYRKVQIIAGGIGITAYLSVLQEFVKCKKPCTEFNLHWFCRDENLCNYIMEEYNLEELVASCERLYMTLHHTSLSERDSLTLVDGELTHTTGLNNLRVRVTSDALPIQPSPLASAEYWFGNLGRFLLLLFNSVVCLILSYVIYAYHQDPRHVWSRIWSPVLVIVVCSGTALGFVTATRRYPLFLVGDWESVPQATDEDGSVSGSRSNDAMCQGQANATETIESYTGVQHRYGRVPLSHILLPLAVPPVLSSSSCVPDNKEKRSAAICVCGPNALCDQVRQQSAKGTPIYQEHFEM